MNTDLFRQMAQSIIDGEDEEAERLAHKAIAQGVDPLEAINQGFVAGIDQVGERFSCGDAFLPELVMAGEAMKAAIAVLEPEMARQGTVRQSLGKVILGTVAGDIHDIGKTLVGTLLSANGFEVIDLGVDVPVEMFADQARSLEADIVGVSALLTTTMTHQRDVIEALEDMGLRPKVKVMVGGAPVTQSWVDEIRADGFSEDAVGAVSVARQLLANKPIRA
jgi:corrinoid protein of di/trimethylamine methyltransferase